MNELDSWNFFSIKWVEVAGDITGIQVVLAIAVVGLLALAFTMANRINQTLKKPNSFLSEGLSSRVDGKSNRVFELI